MKHLLIASILFFISFGAFADERQREIEYEAINLVIKKYGKGLENRLKGTGVNPSYRSWYENDCFVSIAAGKYQQQYLQNNHFHTSFDNWDLLQFL